MDHRRTAIVSSLILDHGWDVGWMYREEPDDDHDSGWRLFAGAEDEDHADQPGGFSRQPLSAVLDADPSIEELLDEPVGTCWERLEEGDGFRRQLDFTLDD